MEIATQTVNLTNFLTNLNSSLTNCNNTSEPNSEQMVSPTIISPTKITPLNEEQQQQPNQIETLDHQSQSHNLTKSNNGHCIVDGTPNDNVNDDETQVTPLHHTYEITDIDGDSVIDMYQDDSTNSDLVLKHDSSASVTAITTTIEPTMVITTGKITTTTENDSTTTDDTDLGKNHTTTSDASGINGPVNDLRV